MIRPLKILIDIGHPAHVHLFKHFAHQMIYKGHDVLFCVRDKEFEIALLEHDGFSYVNFGKHFKTKIGKIWGLFKFTFLVIKASNKYKPDIFLSHGSMYVAIASFFLRKPNIALEDTGNWEQVSLSLPFSEVILTSAAFHKNYGKKQITYEGYHELAYLHPKYFSADKSILNELGVQKKEKYFVLRFVSWNASHDVGQSGMSLNLKRQVVEFLSKHGKVLISSEQKLDPEFEPYRFFLPPEKMHDALAYADLFVGEGATMASECAVLGTPAVYINSIEAGTIAEQEKYGLVIKFRNSKGVIKKIQELINDKVLKEKCQFAKGKMLSEKIDVTAFLVWFIENYPDSFDKMKKYPDYQKIFIKS